MAAWELTKTANRKILFLAVLTIFLNYEASAKVFQVGGSQGWTVPDANTTLPYNLWAENNRFQIGDSLLFVYEANSDSVYQVNKDDYENCNPGSPISTFNDGHSTFTFTQSGPYYFISGNQQNCKNSEKLVVIVLADRTKKAPVPPPPASEPSPPPPSTSPPPPSETTPAPPASNGPPASPPPSEQSPNTNGASSYAVRRELAAIVGVLLGSSVVFLL